MIEPKKYNWNNKGWFFIKKTKSYQYFLYSPYLFLALEKINELLFPLTDSFWGSLFVITYLPFSLTAFVLLLKSKNKHSLKETIEMVFVIISLLAGGSLLHFY